MYAKIENDVVVEWPIYDITKIFPNTSFPDTIIDESLPDGYVIVYPTPEIVTNQYSKNIEETPTKKNGKWVQTWKTVDLTLAEIQELQALKSREVEIMRAEAYRNESDPLFFKSQRGEATHQEWLDKVAEIKSRYSE
jgi:hypothetical protein